MASAAAWRHMREEADQLAWLARELAAAAEASPEPLLRRLPSLPGDALEAEKRLTHAHGHLRAGYLQAMAARTSLRWRTPATGRMERFPGSDFRYDHAYDRQHAPQGLEARLGNIFPHRAHAAQLCASGMSALHGALQALATLGDERPLFALASYFETHTLLKLSSYANRWRRPDDSAELAAAIAGGECGVALIEPVQYDWLLGDCDWDAILAALARSPRLPVLLLDSTLSGGCPRWASILSKLIDSPAPLVLCARSGLKLDQQGLELANLGVQEGWSSDAALLARFSRAARAARVVSGCGVGWEQACQLAPSFVLHSACLEDYSRRIFASARRLREEVELSGELFAQTVPPAGGWDVPFVFYRLRDGGSDAYRQLAALLEAEARRRGLSWQMSGSFGFRSDRFETILPDEYGKFTPGGVLKVAAGCYQGARFEAILDLLNELASFDTLAQARQAWKAN